MYFNLTETARSIRKYPWSPQSSKAGECHTISAPTAATERPTIPAPTADTGRPFLSLLGLGNNNIPRGPTPTAGGGLIMPTVNGGTHILGAPQLPNRA